MSDLSPISPETPRQPAAQPWRRLDLAVWFVALAAGFLNLLNYHLYPLLRPEVGLVLLGLAAVAWLMSALRKAAGPRLGFALSALFVAIVIDLSTSIDLQWFYALWAGLALIAWFAETALLKLTLAAFGSVFLFQFVALTTGIGAPPRPANYAKSLQDPTRPTTNRPAIVHLVLDSYLGLDSMALGPEHYRTLRAEQVAFFTGRGFQVYPRAYSRHVKTVNSLPEMLSFGEQPRATSNRNLQYAIAEELPYFTELDARGYRTSAVLPTFLDLCVNQPLTHCRKFERSALTSMLETDLSAADRATVMGFTLLQLAALPGQAAEQLQLRANQWFGTEGRRPYNRTKLLPLASLGELDRFADDLATLRPGEARFLHVLLPHDPYIFDARCTVLAEADWLDEHGPGTPEARERAYADQVRCLQSRLARLLDRLDRTAAGREAIVIVHGDHGSRISPIAPFLGGPELTEREMLMSHSTLFAIRVPGEAGAQVPGTFALDELMADFRARDFAAAPRPQPTVPRILMMDPYWVPTEWRKLPDFD
ncbi:MAG: hypothetical protein ACK4GD_03335 [Sphingomonadaceae bacterium]